MPFNWLDSRRQTYSCCWAVTCCVEQYAGFAYQWVKPHIASFIATTDVFVFKLLDIICSYHISWIKCWWGRNVMALVVIFIVWNSFGLCICIQTLIHTRDWEFCLNTYCPSVLQHAALKTKLWSDVNYPLLYAGHIKITGAVGPCRLFDIKISDVCHSLCCYSSKLLEVVSFETTLRNIFHYSVSICKNAPKCCISIMYFPMGPSLLLFEHLFLSWHWPLTELANCLLTGLTRAPCSHYGTAFTETSETRGGSRGQSQHGGKKRKKKREQTKLNTERLECTIEN